VRPLTIFFGFFSAMAVGDMVATGLRGQVPDLSYLGLSGGTFMGTYFLLPIFVIAFTEIRAYSGVGPEKNWRIFLIASCLSLPWLTFYPQAAVAVCFFWTIYWLIAWIIFPPECLEYCAQRDPHD
jgi:hypothetical protein